MHIGIDLGTSSSRIARTTWQEAASLVPDYQDSSQWVTRSLVYVDLEGALVGQAVNDLLEDQPTVSVFRDLPAAWEQTQPLGQDASGRPWSAAAVTALLLKKLKRDLEVQSTEPIEGIAIAIPADTSETARRAVLAAARIAGWPQAKLVDQPTAIAAHYGLLESNSVKTVMIVDAGGGAFRVSVLRLEDGQTRSLANSVEPHAAGRELDRALSRQIAEQFVLHHHFDPRTDPASQVNLQRRSEELKVKWLSHPFGVERATLFLGGQVTECVWLEADLRAWIESWLSSACTAAERTLDAAGLTWTQLDHLLMSGEPFAAPLFQQAFETRLPHAGEQLRRHQPGLAIACGAALWSKLSNARSTSGRCQLSAGSKPRTSGTLGFHTLDTNTGERLVDPVIAAGTPLPATGQRSFRINRPDQTRMMLELMLKSEQESAPVSIGHFAVPLAHFGHDQEINVLVEWHDDHSIAVTAGLSGSTEAVVWRCSPKNVDVADQVDHEMEQLVRQTLLRD